MVLRPSSLSQALQLLKWLHQSASVRYPDLSGMAGEANDAVAVWTRGRMRDAPRLFELLETECPQVWIRLSRERRLSEWEQH